jgi:probable phosphoglycerate mutase
MTRFFLIRHAATNDGHIRLFGRTTDVPLSAAGRAQGECLAQCLIEQGIAGIYSSPQLRALETARFLENVLCRPVRIAPELDELDYGDWSGRTFEELSGLSEWRVFNSARSWARVPGGEFMPDLQARIVGLLERLRRLHGDETLALVSHADVIRAALAHCLGMSLDLSLRLEVATGSVTVVELDGEGSRVMCVNTMGALNGAIG